jgi:TonB family protein
VYWFNPLLWVAGTRLREESEQACDDAVLSLGVDAPEYAGHLLDLARDAARHRSRWFLGVPAPAIVRPSSFERRVTAMLNAHLNRTPLTFPARILAGAALFAITIPLAGFGQNSFSTVTGIVTDPEGRMIPNVEVVLRSTQRDARSEVKTNRLGQYEFVGVADGDYVLEAQFMGFRPLRDAISVAGQPVQRNLSMDVGMIQETLTIVGGGATTPASRPQRRADGPQWRPAAEYDPCSASPVGGCLKPPTKIRDVKPEYPPHLSDAKVGGVVVLRAKIGTEGSVVSAQLANPADRIDPALAQAAIAAVNQWQFTPTQLGGVPIETEMQVTVNFVAR